MKATIIYLVDPETQEVLMAKKTRKVGVGCWFGYGGKHEEGESDDDCILRELKTESGGIEIPIASLEKLGIMSFFNKESQNPSIDEPTFEVVCYRAFVDRHSIEPVTTDEMAEPTWFSINNLPLHEMKPGDEYFVPHIIAGTRFNGWLHFKKDYSVIDYLIEKAA